jgi:hypothetical protein
MCLAEGRYEHGFGGVQPDLGLVENDAGAGLEYFVGDLQTGGDPGR